MAYRVLIVAGENDVLRALPGQLGENVEAQLLDTADDALWEVRSNPPEAIIADLNLPGMSGLEMAEIMPNFDVPTRVLLWSREADMSAQKQAEGYGVYRFLSGPVSSDELRSTIHEAIHAQPAVVPEAPPVAHDVAPAPPPEPAPPPPEPPAPKERFKPARVVLPSPSSAPASSSPASTPPVSHGRSSLASRTRTAAAEKHAEKAPPAEKAPHHPSLGHRRREGTLVLTADNLAPIKSIMSQLSQDLGAQSIMLTDRAGMVLVEVGTTHGLPMMIVLPLLSTSFSTAGEVARQLREEDATTLYIHEGVNYDLYCFDVAQRFLLVLVFNKKVASSKIGAVWVNAKRAIRELRDALS